MKKLLSRKEAMYKLGVKSAHFSKMCNGLVAGIPPLPIVQYGRQLLFRDEALDQWILEVESTCKKGR